VIEYNCRFGDPETQVVLPLLESDLLTVMQAVTAGKLGECEVKFRKAHACCVVLASAGYPGSYGKGYAITIPEAVRPNVYVAGAALEDGGIVTSGGRVLGVTAVEDSLPAAVRSAYALAEQVTFENRYFRKDIGQRALNA
jgi:phosphoribosylamine--glycine ligase